MESEDAEEPSSSATNDIDPSSSECVQATDNGASCVVIGSTSSAFSAYNRSLTVLTNLHRGNVKAITESNLDAKKSVTAKMPSFDIFAKIRDGNLNEEDLTDTPGLNVLDSAGKTPLMIATCVGNLKIVKILLSNGAAADFRGKNRETALMHAAAKGKNEISSCLIDSGAEVNASDADGNTPLMYAVVGNHIEVIKILLHNGARMHQRNEADDSALTIAYNKERKAAQDTMESYLNSLLSRITGPTGALNEIIRITPSKMTEQLPRTEAVSPKVRGISSASKAS